MVRQFSTLILLARLVRFASNARQSPAQSERTDQPSDRATQRIVKEVRHELLMLPYLDVFDYIAFKVEGYKVTLLGAVTRPSVKSDAGNAVKGIEGVESVDNQIDVL